MRKAHPSRHVVVYTSETLVQTHTAASLLTNDHIWVGVRLCVPHDQQSIIHTQHFLLKMKIHSDNEHMLINVQSTSLFLHYIYVYSQRPIKKKWHNNSFMHWTDTAPTLLPLSSGIMTLALCYTKKNQCYCQACAVMLFWEGYNRCTSIPPAHAACL